MRLCPRGGAEGEWFGHLPGLLILTSVEHERVAAENTVTLRQKLACMPWGCTRTASVGRILAFTGKATVLLSRPATGKHPSIPYAMFASSA